MNIDHDLLVELVAALRRRRGLGARLALARLAVAYGIAQEWN